MTAARCGPQNESNAQRYVASAPWSSGLTGLRGAASRVARPDGACRRARPAGDGGAVPAGVWPADGILRRSRRHRPPLVKPLTTTICGSLPKPAWLAQPQALWAPWLLEGDALAEGKRDAVRLVLRDQERAGIDIVSDGEQTRRHFVTTFIENLDGVDFEHKRTVRIRNRYDADVPVVVGPVARRGPVFVGDAAFLKSATDRQVKFTLPGPMTMVDTLYDTHYRSREKLAHAFAEILNAEARAIAATGVDVIQFDEPAFNVYFEEVRDWGVAALERAAEGLACKTAVHICYGYGIKANTDWKKTLGSEWRQYESTFPLLAASRVDQVSLECANSHVPLELIGLLEGKDVMVGAIDVATDAVETPEQVAATIRQALQYVAPAKLYPCTNCGMVPLSRQAVAVLRDLQPLTGNGLLVFRGERHHDRPMSDNTVNAALRAMGFSTDEVTGHGFRATARTMLHERLGFDPHVIEAQLAHSVQDALGRAYNRTEFLEQRRKMMQAWADYLDKLRKAPTDSADAKR